MTLSKYFAKVRDNKILWVFKYINCSFKKGGRLIKKCRYGFDIDGVLTSRWPILFKLEKLIARTTNKFPYFGKFLFAILLRLLPVNRVARKVIRELYKKGHRIILVTSRQDSYLSWVTRRWLSRAGVPYHIIVFNGDKKEMIGKYEIDYFCDSDPEIIANINKHYPGKAMNLREIVRKVLIGL